MLIIKNDIFESVNTTNATRFMNEVIQCRQPLDVEKLTNLEERKRRRELRHCISYRMMIL